MTPARYVVKNENALGVIHSPSSGLMCVLAGDIFAGGPDPKNGITTADPRIEALRPATLTDFARFRVMPPPGFAGVA